MGKLRAGSDFRHAVGAAGVVITGEDHRDAPRFAGGEDLGMVGGHDDVVADSQRQHALIHPDDKRLTGEEPKRLPGKALCAETRRDHREY